MKIGVFWRKFRNVELQRRLTPKKTYDDAYEEAYHHYLALKEAGFDVVMIQWEKDPKKTLRNLIEEEVDLVFNASSFKEIAFLETFDIPYVGSGPDLVATNKGVRKGIVALNGLPTPKYVVAESPDSIPEIELEYPLFVKPLRGRGSAGISEENVINEYDELPKVIEKITEKIKQPALIEEFIKGKELTVGVIGYKDPKVLPVLEIEYRDALTNTYEHKMFDNEIIYCPARISKEVQEKVKAAAYKAYKVLNAKDYSRIDIILDEENTPYFLEINTFAGLTMTSEKGENPLHHGYMGYMAKEAGYSRSDFMKAIVNSAIERYALTKDKKAI